MSEYLTESMSKFVNYMKQEDMAKTTINSYVSVIEKVSEIDSRLYRLTNKQIQDFILESDSKSAQNIKISALKKYYLVLHPSKRIKVFIRPKKAKNLPVIMSIKDVNETFVMAHNYKHRFMLETLYYHGFRRSELFNLKFTDIDRNRMCITIRNSKNKKDRQIPITKQWLESLTKYYKIYKPLIYVFNGQTKGKKYTPESLRNVIKYCSVNISKKITAHKYRHSFATHLHEKGVSIKYIQELLGHKRVTTTEIYTHVNSKSLAGITECLIVA